MFNSNQFSNLAKCPGNFIDKIRTRGYFDSDLMNKDINQNLKIDQFQAFGGGKSGPGSKERPKQVFFRERYIALIDMDAFYAQCHSVRLGLPHSTPLAILQWRSIITCNHAARGRGVDKMGYYTTSKAACPELVLSHVDTYFFDQ